MPDGFWVQTILPGLVGIIVGILATVLVSKHYYNVSTRDLMQVADRIGQETKGLKDASRVAVSILSKLGAAEVQFDSEGYPTSLIIRASGTATATATATGDGTRIRHGEGAAEAKTSAGGTGTVLHSTAQDEPETTDTSAE